MTLSVVTYLWGLDEGSKFPAYRVGDVRLLQRMVSRHLAMPHEFVVITDRPESFITDSNIRAIPIDWTTHVPNTCFVRLMTFAPEMQKLFGERILQLDLDTVIVGDLTPIVSRNEDLVLWRNPRKWVLTYPEVGYAKKLAWFNGAVMLHRPGTWGVIWQNFDPKDTNNRDDQWLISDYAGQNHPAYWDENDGIYRPARPSCPWAGVSGDLPSNAKLVTFSSTCKPWLPDVIAENPWIKDFRR